MRVVLCHHCWTWVFPQGTHCPECKHAIALDTPDPTIDELSQRLGTATMRLSPVGWDRPKLPSRGELWGTTTGLLYWPLLTPQPNGSIVSAEASSRSSMSWSLFSLWCRADGAHEMTGSEEWMPLPDAGQSLGQSFLDAPGAAFIPRENVVKITCRGRYWTIHRTIGRALRFGVPSPSSQGTPTGWRSFFQQDAWRNISAVT
ncbi:MAG: hypothetical protein Q8K78_14885 [Planctomycetaceae bacterium]|nr:hypothetical protein [Planctomycetaceae bacterium]